MPADSAEQHKKKENPSAQLSEISGIKKVKMPADSAEQRRKKGKPFCATQRDQRDKKARRFRRTSQKKKKTFCEPQRDQRDKKKPADFAEQRRKKRRTFLRNSASSAG